MPAACPSCGATGGSVVLESPDRAVGGCERFQVLRCSGCGLAYTFPRDLDFAKHYPAQSYHAYQRARDSRFNRLRLWLITRAAYGPISHRPPGRLLDVGCGTGDLAAAFRRQGWSVSGVEPSAEGAAVAAESGIEVHHGTLDGAPWAPESFDVVIFNHSLEHTPDPRRALRRAYDLLAPGGMLGIAVPNFGSWQRRVFGPSWFQLDVPRHLQHFDEPVLRELVERCGFETVRVRTASLMPGLLGSIQYALFGRQLLGGRPRRIMALLLYPAVAASDLVLRGDCLNLVASRNAARP